jgi:hypothetical protein
MDYYIGLVIVIVIAALLAIIVISHFGEQVLKWRLGVFQTSTRGELLGAGAIAAAICYWIVGIWVTTPVMGELHDNVKVKIFWTALSVVFLLIFLTPLVEQAARHRWNRHGDGVDGDHDQHYKGRGQPL